MDTGIDANHSSLQSQVHKDLFVCFVGYHEDDLFHDFNGHGTHVAGIVAMNGNGSYGVAPNVRVASLRINYEWPSSQFWSNIIKAIEFATENGIPVLNASIRQYDCGCMLGTCGRPPAHSHAEYIEALRQAIKNFPGVFVAGAGNEGINNDGAFPAFPASFRLPNVISVGASNQNDKKAGFSNYGKTTVCLFAPGVEIWSTWHGSYIYDQGTSAATPFVAGTVALMLSVNPALTPAQIRQILIETSDAADCYYITNHSVAGTMGGGRLNAGAAVSAAAFYFTPVSDTANVSIRARTGANLTGSLAIPAAAVIGGVPHTVTGISDNGFAWLNAVTDVYIPRGVTAIGNGAFQGNALQTITLPDTLLSIGWNAFKDSGLTAADIPDSVASVGAFAFESAYSLTTVRFGTGLLYLGRAAFLDTHNLRQVYTNNQRGRLPAGLHTIHAGTFTNSGLERIVIHGNIRTIDYGAFTNTQSLTHVYFYSGVRYIRSQAFIRSAVQSVALPPTVAYVGQAAFRDTFNLQTADMAASAGLTRIENQLFFNSALHTIYLPSGITHIGDRAFANAANLSRVTIKRPALEADDVPLLGADAFARTRLQTICVPCWDSVDTYGAAPGWRDFADIITAAAPQMTPVYTFPAGLTAVERQRLQTISLPVDWEWTAPNTLVGTAGLRTFEARFTPADLRYYVIYRMLEVEVSAAAAVLLFEGALFIDAVINTHLFAHPFEVQDFMRRRLYINVTGAFSFSGTANLTFDGFGFDTGQISIGRGTAVSVWIGLSLGNITLTTSAPVILPANLQLWLMP